jgi:phenylacetate-CoA ligase
MKLILSLFKAINIKMLKYPKSAYFLSKVVPNNKYLFGKKYRKIYKSIDFESGFKNKTLINTINYSIHNVPYYSTKYNNLKIKSIKDFENKIRFIEKTDLITKEKELLSNDFDYNSHETVTTGGTSGPPTKFYLKKNRYKKEYAFFNKIWSTKGYKGQLRGVIRNQKLPDNMVYKINPITKELIFDGFRNDKGYIKKIYETILKFNIKYLQCYPSSAYYFATIAEEENWDLSFLKGIFLSSEKYLNYQMNLLKNKLNLPVISVYGHSEKLILAVDFDGDGTYKVLNDYGYLELIDSENKTIKTTNKVGEIVGTTFDNFGQPLIRYKTGDYSSYIEYNEEGLCVLKGIEGRWHGMKIYNKDGSYVTPAALNLHDVLLLFTNGLQYYQNKKGYLEVRIIPGKGYSKEIEEKIYSHYASRLAPTTKIHIKHVVQLIKKKNGKFSLLETELE